MKLSNCVETNMDARLDGCENKSDQQFYADWMRAIEELRLVTVLKIMGMFEK